MGIKDQLKTWFRLHKHPVVAVDRETMIAALKTSCVPTLRQMGFKGSFPNFYRESNGFVALLNVQFYRTGGSFCVNLSFADRDRKNLAQFADIPVNQLRISQTRDRRRLGSPEGGDHWFSYGATQYGTFIWPPEPIEVIIQACNRLLISDAEPWWHSREYPPSRSSERE